MMRIFNFSVAFNIFWKLQKIKICKGNKLVLGQGRPKGYNLVLEQDRAKRTQKYYSEFIIFGISQKNALSLPLSLRKNKIIACFCLGTLSIWISLCNKCLKKIGNEILRSHRGHKFHFSHKIEWEQFFKKTVPSLKTSRFSHRNVSICFLKENRQNYSRNAEVKGWEQFWFGWKLQNFGSRFIPKLWEIVF